MAADAALQHPVSRQWKGYWQRLLRECFSLCNLDGMYLMYVDESGDAGLVNSPTRYFVLTGVVMHELRWHEALTTLIEFRKRMRGGFGLLLKEEIHSGKMLNKPGGLVRIKRNDRLTIIRHFLDELAKAKYLNFVTVRVDKQGKPPGYDPFEKAWEALIQRFENTLRYRNFPDARVLGLPIPRTDKGVIFCDDTDAVSLRRIYRRMRTYNPVPNLQAVYGSGHRQMPLVQIVEDPSVRSSHHSYFIQAADAAAFAAYQLYAPSSYVRRKGARSYYKRLGPVLCKAASPRNPLGIVEL
jgi:hypothetical protein